MEMAGKQNNGQLWSLIPTQTYHHNRGSSNLLLPTINIQEKNMELHPHFMMFGGGGRMCPGKEVGTVEIATFLHYFVTRYRSVPFVTPHSVAKKNNSSIIIYIQRIFLTRSWCCRWEEEGRNTILRFPRVEAPNGLHIRVQDYWSCNVHFAEFR